MSTNGESSDQTVQKIIAEMEANVSVLSWIKAAEDNKEAQEHIRAIKAALSKAKKDLVKA
ncbi:MAG: hypothetical protein ABF679_08705 [Lentilactobacillus diolivorans]|jgi:hypothetical protein|uniref:Uncharacterized protein n=2 Tax=Lentilactobacillus diolivorans TaxID=179838 RepID=A0A0R1SA70_9LACO|nr:hypothetical protein [Lentilactobacillus diolivorans]RRG03316.1 MAG: hypothetical protein DUD34_05260 [Lactobacillus sp.]KRL65353.1 hypothetical protein FC85_GL000178 [Lentilactobacillus diolivorans DSM 14421]MCH4163745.1 hypothetical protein [Lentilactobacillus diolivorans]MDH5105468.1 hypothetical protein [Lentilactobacillus diolivorans]GEP24417.1 hypothetical protein LDI01_20100 [Lentilactobacillus diolivorans]